MIPHVNESKEEFEDVDLTYNNEGKNIKWHRQLLLNKPLKISFALILTGVVAPILLYQFFYFATSDLETPDDYSSGSCLVSRSSRLPCGLGNIPATECHPQCCYDFGSDQCFHRFPSRFSFLLDRIWAENITLKPRIATVPFKYQASLTSLRLSIDEVSSSHLILTYYDARNKSIEGRRLGAEDRKDYEYIVDSPELNIVVNSSRGIIFDTLRGPLIASDDIWEIAFKLTEETLYGFGEIPIREGMTKVIYNRNGGLNSIPLIFAKSNDSFHGLLIDVPQPTEISFRTDHRILLRSINNFGLKFHLFVGPKPEDIMKDVMKYMNYDNKLEYWMLGTHFCSEQSETINATIDTFIEEASRYNMPVESHCVRPIVFSNKCENDLDSVIEGANALLNNGKRFIPHLSAHVLYKDPYTNDNITDPENVTETREQTNTCLHDLEVFTHLFLQNPDTDGLYIGTVDGESVIYPVYGVISDEIMKQLANHTDFHGIVLENTWPIDETDKSLNETHSYLPYFSEHFEHAFENTPQWNATINGQRYLYNANQYGNYFVEAIHRIKSVPTWASSQWMNNNVYVNRQNIDTSWTNLNRELIQAALGGISGHWLWSTPICGDTDNFDVDIHSSLCLKWYLAATYFPIAKIYSKEYSRQPDAFSATFRTLMIDALRTRLSLAPYFYTTLQEGPLLRPMFYQFPDVEEFNNMTSQFSVGDSLVIVPNLHPSQSVVHFWKLPGIWYEMWSGLEIKGEELEAVTITTAEFDFVTFVKGGAIIVMQKDVKQTAEKTRSESNLLLKIALHCHRTNNTEIKRNNITECNAEGTLYMDSSKTLYFTASAEELKITAVGDFEAMCNRSDNTWTRYIDEIDIYGLDDEFNNYDHKRNVQHLINLCGFDENHEILFNFLE